MRKKQKSQPHPRFSHSPPGHTCGLPCCSEDIHIHLRLNAPASRYNCMPTPHRQADLENNFTFRRSRLLAGRPTLTNKFYSLQTAKGLRSRAGLPKFHDDWGIEKGRGEAGGGAAGPDQSASEAARENLRQYRASIETDTDDVSEPYVDRVVVDSCSAIRTPVRYLQPWECFHKREISLPDHPGTPRRMVFLDYRPGESHDGAEGGEAEEMIEVYTSGYKPSSSSSSTPKPPSGTVTHTSSVTYTTSSSPALQVTSSTTTHSSSSSSTQTTSTASSSTASRPRVSYSGAVRPIPAPTLHTLLKSALKKPKPDERTESPKDGKCPACQSRYPSASHGKGQGQNTEGQTVQGGGQCQGQRVLIYLSESPSPSEACRTGGSGETPCPPQQDSEDLYAEGHVYDVLSDVAPRLLEENARSADPELRNAYDKVVAQTPPPVPPTRRNNKPKPDRGRKAITPELKRKFTPDEKSLRRNKSEERYSTFPTRRRYHHYEELTPLKTDGTRRPAQKNPASHGKELGFYRVDDKASLLLDGEESTEECLYDSLNPAFLSDSWSLSRDKGGGSVGSVDSARLSHASYGSCGCTCLSGDTLRASLDDVGKASDVSAGDVSEGGGKKAGFLADNPITLIL